ncbi:MAG: FAD-dependent oxidoreductase [Luteolibacter sp.]
MNASRPPRWTIVGQGLAGTCLAWCLWERGVDFRIVDRGAGGSSRVAAGLVNPVTGKNFEPSWRIGDFLPEALDFYGKLDNLLDRRLWYPLTVLRLAETEKEWRKITGKLDEAHVSPWVESTVEMRPGWCGAVKVTGGGRLDTRGLMEASRAFFEKEGMFQEGSVAEGDSHTIWCEGAVGLMAGKYGPARCAKGEILTLKADWPIDEIRVGAGGWLVPLGGGLFKVGATYEWNELDETPTEKGRTRGEEIAWKLGGEIFEITAHEAGIRPILRRSEPLIGPLEEGGWMFNALGSKGSLYAPGMAARLTRWLLDGVEPEAEVDFREFLKNGG